MVVAVLTKDPSPGRPAGFVDFAVMTGDGLRHDSGFSFEAVRLAGVAIVLPQPPVDGDCGAWPGEKQQSGCFLAGRNDRCCVCEQVGGHHVAANSAITAASTKVPAAKAAASSLGFDTGMLPITSPDLPFTAM